MIPKWFSERRPHLAVALMAMKSTPPDSPLPSAAVEGEIAREIADANQANDSLSDVLTGIFDVAPEPTDDFMRFSFAAYRQLGVSGDVCVFMGRLWTDAVQAWSPQERTQFLLLCVRDPHEVFQALDFAVELFRRVQFTPDEVFPWIAAAHRQVGNDRIQQGFWGCVEAFCIRSPPEAVAVAERWLDTKPELPALGVIGNMIGWLRLKVVSDPSSAALFEALEQRVQAHGHPAWRAIYIQSWAHAVGQAILNEKKALDIREPYRCSTCDEEIAWCFLLNSIVHSDRPSWSWAHRELTRLASPGLDERAKYWAVLAAMHGLRNADQSDIIPAERWRGLFAALLPVAAVSTATWDQILHTLTTLVEEDLTAMRELVMLLARGSGEAWLEVVKQRKFLSFFQLLRRKGLHSVVSGDLCFQSGASSRHLGLVVFSECSVEALGESVVRSSTATQLELLLLEAQRRSMEYPALARLHACLADSVDRVGGSLPELFYEEVARQCLNTHDYRSAIAAAAPNHEYLGALVLDVRERLSATHKASGSSALQMEVPGFARAQRFHDLKLARDVSKTVREHSTFLRLFPTVSLLYGGMESRTFSSDGSLSGPTRMHSSSSTIEVPRLEAMDPEGMQILRIQASTRIATLEALTREGQVQ